MSQSIIVEEEEGGCLAIPARLVEGGLILDGALGGRSRQGMCSHLGDRAPAERKRDVLLELAHENVRR
jgi:hypothetical protein